MNKTHQLFLLFLGLLLSAGCLSGCIKDDLSDCPINVDPDPDPDPTTGTLRLALTYTMHNTQEDDGTYVDLFSQQVRKIDVFVFDEAGHFVQQITEEAAPKFAENYTKEIELPGGNYQFVVWGNHYEDETDHNYDSEADLLHEGRMTLTQITRSTEIEMLTDSLFHGCTPQQVTVVNGEDQIVPIDLMKNRNDVRVIVRWREKGMTEGYCTHTEHAQDITATLIDNNTVHDFLNNIVEKQEVTYRPGRFPEWYNPPFHGEMDVYPTEQEHVYVADFSELRLMKDNPDARLVIHNTNGDIVYEHALTGANGLITRLEQYQTQEALDREDRYLIELLFECEHEEEPDEPDEPDGPGTDEPDEPDGPGTDPTPVPEDPWVAISIKINGWTLIDKDIEL
ncbi:FimB/Mfa2 family fimbrial subunit [Bacteroides caecigallinarum]|uniref:FimB/Mfa2 family fimbrial subunit n=1 Tax=Bacteroides caecigallinarum TaxID=1411144 RepID=UPI001959209A|nr:FimB/Mfa2 family fimbrial subunit [Bacteroides caecigallinarum]MBM6890052.1 FimB/Mfa2 family fimbrial subunit [Bacteroides caecigallinarum]